MIFMYFVYVKNIRPCKHNLYCTISKLEIYMNPLQSEIVFEEHGISTDFLFIGLKESLQLFEICDLFRRGIEFAEIFKNLQPQRRSQNFGFFISACSFAS